MLALIKYLTHDCGLSVSSLFKRESSNMDDIVDIIQPPEIKEEVKPPTHSAVDTPYLFLNIYEDDKEIGDIVIYLYEDELPITTKNFKELCCSKSNDFGYKNSTFHRIIKNFMIQGGDFTNHNGTGGVSIYQRKFEDENFKYQNKKGTISMANAGPNTNGSQFFINTTDNHNLDGKHVVFGEVVEGMDVVAYLNNVKTETKDVPTKHVRINDCGRIWLEEKNNDKEADDKSKYTEFLESS